MHASGRCRGAPSGLSSVLSLFATFYFAARTGSWRIYVHHGAPSFETVGGFDEQIFRGRRILPDARAEEAGPIQDPARTDHDFSTQNPNASAFVRPLAVWLIVFGGGIARCEREKLSLWTTARASSAREFRVDVASPRILSAMFKRILKWVGGIVLGPAARRRRSLSINAIWFRPWFLNLFYDKFSSNSFLTNRSCFPQLGLVEQFGITGHNAKLNDESPAHQQTQFDAAAQAIWRSCMQYPLDKQTASQRLSTARARLVSDRAGRGREIAVA